LDAGRRDKICAMVSRSALKALFLSFAITLFACDVPSFIPSVSSVSSGTILFKDDFSSTTSGWDHTKYAEGIMDYDGGGYRILVNALQANFWSTPHNDFTDVRLEVDTGKLAGPDQNRIGLICRSDDKSYYFFIMSSDGFYGMGIFTNGQAALLGQSEMQSSDKINTGTAINHLRADCNGDDLVFYINGSKLAEVHDPTLRHGKVGVLAGSFDQPGVDIVFDNFVVIKP
jgi:hypothetical protein